MDRSHSRRVLCDHPQADTLLVVRNGAPQLYNAILDRGIYVSAWRPSVFGDLSQHALAKIDVRSCHHAPVGHQLCQAAQRVAMSVRMVARSATS